MFDTFSISNLLNVFSLIFHIRKYFLYFIWTKVCFKKCPALISYILLYTFTLFGSIFCQPRRFSAAKADLYTSLNNHLIASRETSTSDPVLFWQKNMNLRPALSWQGNAWQRLLDFI